MPWRTSFRGETGREINVLPADLADKASLAKVEKLLRDDARITWSSTMPEPVR